MGILMELGAQDNVLANVHFIMSYFRQLINDNVL